MNSDSTRSRSTVRFVCYGLMAVLYVASVPWYRDADAPLVLWYGLPDWVATALLCYVAVAFVNAIAWLATDVTDPPEDGRVGEVEQ